LDDNSTEHSIVDPLIHNSLVRRTLETIGYRTVAFQTDFPTTELTDADFYISIDDKAELNKFETLLIQTSAARIIPDLYSIFTNSQNTDEELLAAHANIELLVGFLSKH